MSSSQTELGKAFEFACLSAIQKGLKEIRTDVGIVVAEDSSYSVAKRSYDGMTEVEQVRMEFASRAAIKMICNLEPRLVYGNPGSLLTLSIQSDSQGVIGDVRDVLCVRSSEQWEIGLSCKHNHDAVKHSRLSGKIDFGEKWLGHPCSENYFLEVHSIFDELERMRRTSGGNARWSDVDDKVDKYYVPILESFMKEFNRIVKDYKDAPANLVHYLIGRKDFYKVITDDNRKTVKIQAINICGTLSQPHDEHHPATPIPLLRLPDRVYYVGFATERKNTIEVICSEGWNIQMRIHNASSRIEPSLKFDIRLIALPNSIYTQMEPWSSVDGYGAHGR